MNGYAILILTRERIKLRKPINDFYNDVDRLLNEYILTFKY